MKKNKIVASLSLLFLICMNINQLSAQSSQPPNVIPPDPKSAEFQKYLGYPVSHSTGIPQINIPLYTMNASGISIPFNLSYHASGIKVDQLMGSIGLGWSMSPGFRITRTVRGNPDDKVPTNDIRDLGTYNWPAENDTINNYLSNDPNFYSDAKFEYLYKITPYKYGDGMFGVLIPHNPYPQPSDTQHDIFSVHLPNVNATFILEWINNELKATTIPESSLKIDVLGVDSSGKFNSFKVTDENGIVYRFGVSDDFSNTGRHFEYNEDSETVTSWLLTEIDPPGINNKITFSFNDPITVSNQANLSNSISFIDEIKGTSVHCQPDPQNNNAPCDNDPKNPIIISNSTASFPQVFSIKSISEINYETGEHISFSYSQASGSYDALDNVLFRNKNNKIIKTINLERDENKQLKKLEISGEGAYKFVYNDQVISAIGGYIGQDFLGLYNGINTSGSGVPKMFLSHSNDLWPYLIGDTNPKFSPKDSQARILQNIIYPTGGQTSFQYEPNMYLEGNVPVCGMGLRIKEIDTYDPVSGKTISKSYTYGENEDGVGNSTLPPQTYRDAYITEDLTITTSGSYRTRTVSPYAHSSFTSEPIIWYDEVTEYNSSNANNNIGKIIYNYEFESTDYLLFHIEGISQANPTHIGPPVFFPDVMRNIGGSPRLVRQEIKDFEGNTVQLVENGYSLDRRLVLNVFPFVNARYVEDNSNEPRSLLQTIVLAEGSSLYQYIGGVGFLKGENYYLELRNHRLTSTTQTDYRNGEAVVAKTSYDYDNTYSFNLKSKTTTTSDEGTITEKYYYPVGDAIPSFTNLTTDQQNLVNTFAAQKNYQSRIIEKEVYKNNTLLSTELYGYKDFGNSFYKLQNPYIKKGTSVFQKPFTLSYDEKGNITKIEKTNGTQSIYAWGYNKQYPIVKIDNITSSEAESLESLIVSAENASNLDVSEVSNNKSTENNLITALDAIRNSLSNTNAMVNTYTYDPIVGITTVTDPKDYTMHYNYNTDFKLESIKDKQDKVITDYEYHYVPFDTYEPIDVPSYTGDLDCGSGETLYEIQAYTISTPELSFGNVEVGDSGVLTFYIENTTLDIFPTNYLQVEISLPDDFALQSPSSFSVTRGTPRAVEVLFNPNEVGAFSGNLFIESTATGQPYISLSGNGTAPPTSGNSKIIDIRDNNGNPISSLDFGSVNQNDNLERTFRIYNTGDSILNLSSIDSSDFFVFGTNPPTGTSIPSGGFVEFRIDFNNYSLNPGNYNATITINSNKTSGNNFLSVSGIVTE